jgi:hypothetical protein
MGNQIDLLQGTLDLLILKTLALGPMHGWGISQRIQQVSKGRSIPPWPGWSSAAGYQPSGAHQTITAVHAFIR